MDGIRDAFSVRSNVLAECENKLSGTCRVWFAGKEKPAVRHQEHDLEV
jgi:hypothetical protein